MPNLDLRFDWHTSPNGYECRIDDLTIAVGPNPWQQQTNASWWSVMRGGTVLERGRDVRDIATAQRAAERVASNILTP